MPTPHPVLAKCARSIVLLDSEWDALSEVPFTTERVLAGEGVTWAGDRPTHSSLILEGLLSTTKAVTEGEIQITAFHVPGGMPDLHGLYLEVPDSDIGALAECHLASLAHQNLRDPCAEHRRLAALLWRVTLVDAATFRERVVNLSQRLAINRLALLFCEMMARTEAMTLSQEGSCQLELAQQHLSEATGLPPCISIARARSSVRCGWSPSGTASSPSTIGIPFRPSLVSARTICSCRPLGPPERPSGESRP